MRDEGAELAMGEMRTQVQKTRPASVRANSRQPFASAKPSSKSRNGPADAEFNASYGPIMDEMDAAKEVAEQVRLGRPARSTTPGGAASI